MSLKARNSVSDWLQCFQHQCREIVLLKSARVGRKRLNPIAARKAARKAKRAGKKRSRAEHAKRRWEEPTQQPQQPSQNSKDQVLKKRSQQSKQAVRAEEQERPKKRVRFAEEVKDEEDLDITVSNDTVDDVDEVSLGRP
ncbi:MAG: hypothetical protein MHM6MM_004306 [Cercozoa sp. M6MM]